MPINPHLSVYSLCRYNREIPKISQAGQLQKIILFFIAARPYRILAARNFFLIIGNYTHVFSQRRAEECSRISKPEILETFFKTFWKPSIFLPISMNLMRAALHFQPPPPVPPWLSYAYEFFYHCWFIFQLYWLILFLWCVGVMISVNMMFVVLLW
jgi:hypothetical protein